MTYPLLYFTDGYCEKIPGPQRDREGNLNVTGKILSVVIVTEALVTLTALVIGILGVFTTIAMHAALAYSLIGLSVVITATWIFAALISHGNLFTNIPTIFHNSVQSKNMHLMSDGL